MMAVVLLASTATTSKVVFATPIETKVGIVVNDEIKEIPKDMGKPFLAEARTFVPLRFVSETLGFKVDWDAKTDTATTKHTSGDVSVQIGSKTVSTPAGDVKMDVQAFIKEGRTYVPIRFVAEALDFEVEWTSAKHIEGFRNYNNDFYVVITGELGDTVGIGTETKDNHGITNYISDNPEDWPETENKYQNEPSISLAKNKAFVEYMEKNYPGKFHIAGYSTNTTTLLGPDIAFNPYDGRHTSSPSFYVFDMRHTDEKVINMNMSWYSEAKDIMEKTLYAYMGVEDGQYIFDYYTRGRTESLPANVWVKTPSGREFQIDTKTPSQGVDILIK